MTTLPPLESSPCRLAWLFIFQISASKSLVSPRPPNLTHVFPQPWKLAELFPLRTDLSSYPISIAKPKPTWSSIPYCSLSKGNVAPTFPSKLSLMLPLCLLFCLKDLFGVIFRVFMLLGVPW